MRSEAFRKAVLLQTYRRAKRGRYATRSKPTGVARVLLPVAAKASEGSLKAVARCRESLKLAVLRRRIPPSPLLVRRGESVH